MWWLAPFVAIACGREPSPGLATSTSGAPPTASAASAAPKQSKLTGFSAKLDGAELALDSALTFSRGGTALHITLSTHPLECEKFAGAGFRLEPGEFLVDFTVAPVVVPGKGEQWMVTGARLGDVSRQGELGNVTVDAFDPTRTVKIGFENVSLPFLPSTLTLNGQLAASGCGILPLTERAKVRPQKELDVRLDDKPLTMNGASVVADAQGRTLRITTEPHACDKGVQGSDVGIELLLVDGSDAPAKTRVTGFSVPRPLLHKAGDGSLTVRSDPGDAPGEQTFTVTGEVALAGHRLVIDGRTRAELCP